MRLVRGGKEVSERERQQRQEGLANAARAGSCGARGATSPTVSVAKSNKNHGKRSSLGVTTRFTFLKTLWPLDRVNEKAANAKPETRQRAARGPGRMGRGSENRSRHIQDKLWRGRQQEFLMDCEWGVGKHRSNNENV